MFTILLLWLAVLPIYRSTDIDEVLSEISDLNKVIVLNATDQINSQQLEINDLVATVKQAVDRIEQLEGNLTGASEEIASLKNQLISTEEKVDSLDQGLAKVLEQVNDVVTEVKGVATSVGNLSSQVDAMDSRVTDVEQEMNGTAGEVTDIAKSVDGISGKVSDIQQEVGETVTKVASVSAGLAGVTDSVKSLQAQMTGTVQLDEDSKIPSSVLPGSYSTHSLEDVQWQSLHMAAAAACIGYPSHSHKEGDSQEELEHWKSSRVVIPAQYGESCYSTCRASHWYKSCAGQVLVGGTDRRVRDRREAGRYFAEHCYDRPSRDQVESRWRDEDILDKSCPEGDKDCHDRVESIAYCCCAKDW